jgi:hypothetical protein
MTKAKRRLKATSKGSNPDIDTIVSGALTGLTTAKWPNRRLPEFRISAFPFCPLLFIGDPGEFEAVYTSDFYFRHGTTEHELIQHAMAHSVNAHLMYGHWACSCDEKHERLQEWTTKPKIKCKKCGKIDWNYVEVTVEYNGLKGHVDMIYRVPDYLQKPTSKLNRGGIGWRFIVKDLKTSNLPEMPKKAASDWTARSAAMSKKYPIPANVIQIKSYAAILRKQYKLNVCGTSLAYLDRSGPVRSRKNFHTVTETWKKGNDELWLGRLDAATDTIKDALKVRDALMAKKKPLMPALRRLVDQRPCRNRKQHDDYMAARFYYDDVPACPFMSRCCSPKASDDKLTSFFAKTMADQWLTLGQEIEP